MTYSNGDGSYSLRDFLAKTAERDNPGDVFELESSKMLEVKVSGRVWSKLGAMVAYKGNLTFKREGTLEGGLMKAFKRAVSQEMSPLAKIEGRGVAYLADQGKEIQILRLSGESLNVNGNDLLAFEDSVQYDITMQRRVAGMAAGGLFSVRVQGHGLVAILSHGKPLTLRVTPHEPLFTDPNATIAWSGNLQPQLRMDSSLRSMIGRGGGETYQMVFQGDGFVVVQPYEEFEAGMLGGESGGHSHSRGGLDIGDLFD
ncbi:MAG: AIM24 family protein [Deinococcus sp.]|uniref:AIM24 family protein n=1 Tax=Deinococcus sp. TaxID=47478 RepID=UPI0026DC14DB|nr:AIM24 family protein [Deinococcus sp.]MDO4246560.1 AIM24 family protein [Deinococcus sp.]